MRYSSLFLQESRHVLTLMYMFVQSMMGAIEIYDKYRTRGWSKITPHEFLYRRVVTSIIGR